MPDAGKPAPPINTSYKRNPWAGQCRFDTPGTYPFVCIVHKAPPYNMTGTIIVTAAPGGDADAARRIARRPDRHGDARPAGRRDGHTGGDGCAHAGASGQADGQPRQAEDHEAQDVRQERA